MVAHDVQNARLRLAGIVQVGKGIAETRGQMQQRGRDLARHAEIAIRRAGHPAFEQAQDASHVGVPVQGGHEMHLGRAGIGKADPHAAGQQRLHQGFRAVHACTPCGSRTEGQIPAALTTVKARGMVNKF